jgi:hypothetical protein
MAQPVNQEILNLKQQIIDDMISYMKYGGADGENHRADDPEFDAGYTQKHVDQCSVILDEFLALLEKPPETQKNKYIMAVVKNTVLKLNKLNEKCDGGLIETDQREDICKLIISAAHQAGLESGNIDITEEWREW